MTTDLQQQKLAKVFASFDFDQDGVIEELDITAMAQIWCEVYEVSTNSAEWRQIHGHGNAMWHEMRGSTGAHGLKRVTLDEWVAWGTKPDFLNFVETAAVPFSMAVFDVADKDRDGKLTMPEMMAAQSKSGMSPEETQLAFDALDTDGDGYVTGEQYAQAAREFYLSDNPNAPGNLIAGDL